MTPSVYNVRITAKNFLWKGEVVGNGSCANLLATDELFLYRCYGAAGINTQLKSFNPALYTISIERLHEIAHL